MANPNRPRLTSPAVSGTTVGERPDFEQIRHKKLLDEAVLVQFAAHPDPRPAFANAKLRWDVAMPATVIPGVQIEVHLAWNGDHVVSPKGELVVPPFSPADFALYLKTPLAAREMARFELGVDVSEAPPGWIPRDAFAGAVIDETRKQFPQLGLTLRGDAKTELHLDFFTIRVPMEFEVPNWRNVEVDVTFSFRMISANGDFRIAAGAVRATVSPGVLTGIVTQLHSETAATTMEKMCEFFIPKWPAPEVAGVIEAKIRKYIEDHKTRLMDRSNPPVPYRLYDITVNPDGLNYRLLPTPGRREEPPSEQ